MSKTAVSQWDPIAANNTDIGGITLDGSAMLVSQVDNAIREMMAQIASAGFVTSTSAIAYTNVEDQTISGGARVTVKDLGALSAAGSNTLTPDPGDRPKQKITNDHAGSILPGSNNGDYLLEVINASGAGAVTTTGWTLKGDSFDTTTTSKFLCSCHVSSDQKLMVITKTA